MAFTQTQAGEKRASILSLHACLLLDKHTERFYTHFHSTSSQQPYIMFIVQTWMYFRTKGSTVNNITRKREMN